MRAARLLEVFSRQQILTSYRGLRWIALAIAWGLLVTVCVAQEPLEESTEVTLVEVPLQILDAAGQVQDQITLNDLALFDEGVPQIIRQLRPLEPPTTVEGGCEAWAARRWLLLFDLAESSAPEIATAVETLGASPWLAGLSPCEPVAVMALDATGGLRLHLSWSLERGLLLRALRRLTSSASSPGLEESAPVRRIAERLAGLGEAVNLLRHGSGGTVVVYIGRGFEADLAVGTPPEFEPWEAATDDTPGRLEVEGGDLRGASRGEPFATTDLRRSVRELAEDLRRVDAEFVVMPLGLGVTDTERRDGLAWLARDVGGSLATAEGLAARPPRWTHLLTFQPSKATADGRYHRLEVRLRTRDGDIEHRPGYFAPKPAEQVHPVERDLLASPNPFVAEPRREIPFEVLALPLRGDGEIAYVPLLVEIPAGLDEGAFELFAYAVDSGGALRDSLHVPLDQAVGQGFKVYGDFELAPDIYRLRFLVRSTNGAVGTKSLTLDVPRFADGKPRASPPLVIESEDRWSMVRELIDDRGTGGVVYPFVTDGRPFVPRVTLPPAGEPFEVVLLFDSVESESLDEPVVRALGGGRSMVLEVEVLGMYESGRHQRILHLRIPGGLPDWAELLEVVDIEGSERFRSPNGVQ